MYQRLLLLLSVLLISIAGMSQDVMTPTDGDYVYDKNAAVNNANRTNPAPAGPGIMQKWVHDPSQKNRIGSWQTVYKSYRIGTLSFRLRFPNGYNPANKYPMVIFLHGAGEAASRTNLNNGTNGDANRENQDQLYWGAQLFSSYIDAGLWNGFLLFPQNTVDASGAGTEWNSSTITPLNAILDKLAQYNGLDVDRVITMGLSAGGLGTLNYANFFPQRIAMGIPACPEKVQGEIPDIDRFLQIPLWMAAGGADTGPDPANVFTFRDAWNAKGGNLYLTYYPTSGHDVWEAMWPTTDINNKLILPSYWNAAHKAQPLVYGQNTQFCAGTPISAKMGLTSGFANYEWQYDNGSGFTTVLTGASANTYTATQLGTYRVHFQRVANGAWSDWTPNPVVISSKACALSDTLYAEHFDGTPNTYYSVFPGQGGTFSSYNYFNTTCQTGLFVNGTEVFTQDASGRQGGRFMLHNTTPTSKSGTDTICPYYVGDQIWRLNSPVTGLSFGTDYLFSFYIGNQSTPNVGTSSPNPLAQIIPTINDVALTQIAAQAISQGNVSWKKYTYLWNSGGYNYAQFALKNNTRTGFGANGNDFAIDEISLTKFKPIAMPGFATKNVSLWTKANTLPGADGSPVSVWTNNDINGNSLQQVNTNIQPVLNNDATANINFNPVVSYNVANARAMLVKGGFSGGSTITHNSVNAYIVARFANTTQNSNVFTEPQSGGTNSKISVKLSPSGIVNWMVGTTKAQDSIATPANTIESGKPIIWSFSKSTAFTGSNNKLDIRKNGIVVASTNTPATTTFVGNNGTTNTNVDFMTGRITNAGTNGSDIRGGFDGDVAEIIYILDSNITALKQRQIESYLAIKYGTTLGNTANPVSYVASDSVTNFWTGDITYQNDVFGIGTDSLSGLVQTKSNSVNSGSGDGTGQFMKGNLVLSANTPLTDKQFLMIGSNNGALTQTVIQTGQAAAVAVGSTRINRNWKVANTGGVGSVSLSFDTTGLMNLAGGPTVSNYALMIDDFGDAQYNHTLRFVTATGVSGKKLIFSNVILNNNNAFTIITMKSALLPAIWLGFTAEAVNGNGLLNWKTSDELNVDRYIVEHSFNGVSFSVIGSVTANNNSGVNNYTFTDNGLAAGTHYYRIRRVDLDGRSEYSDTKTIKITTAGANVQVRPNPVVGSTLQLAISVQQNTKTSIQVMSVEGKLLLQQRATLATGNNLVNLDVSNVPSGVYLVQVQLTDGVVTKKFVRQH